MKIKEGARGEPVFMAWPADLHRSLSTNQRPPCPTAPHPDILLVTGTPPLP